MRSKLVLSMLIACAAPMALQAADDPANSTLLKQCESAKGEVKEECKEVATKMLQNPDQEIRPDTTSQETTHSGPAMDAEPKAAKPKPAKPAAPKPDATKDAEKVEPKQ